MTLGELIERITRRFAAAPLFYGHGTDNARDEAAWLVLRGLGLPFDADPGGNAIDTERIERLAERRIKERILPVDGQPALRPTLKLTFSFDHRAVDGARGAEFLETLASLLEEPAGLVR